MMDKIIDLIKYFIKDMLKGSITKIWKIIEKKISSVGR